MQRHPSWPACLDAYFQAHRQTPFQYGRFDCCLMVADAVLAMTGTDLAAAFRGRYESATAAGRAVKECCGSISIAMLAAKIAAENGMPEIEPLRAGRGDMVLLRRPRSLGVVATNGREIVVAGRNGLQSAPLTDCLRAWRI